MSAMAITSSGEPHSVHLGGFMRRLAAPLVQRPQSGPGDPSELTAAVTFGCDLRSAATTGALPHHLLRLAWLTDHRRPELARVLVVNSRWLSGLLDLAWLRRLTRWPTARPGGRWTPLLREPDDVNEAAMPQYRRSNGLVPESGQSVNVTVFGNELLTLLLRQLPVVAFPQRQDLRSIHNSSLPCSVATDRWTQRLTGLRDGQPFH